MLGSELSWRHSLALCKDKSVWMMLVLGFSAGLPLLLIFSSLSLWLREAGVERSAITFFSWAALGYSFKFVWAPLLDKIPLPWLSTCLGRRRSWLLLAQLMIIASILFLASIDPSLGLPEQKLMALAAVALGFSAATQDIVIDAYRIESADSQMQSLLSATYIVGYRVAMLLSGAGVLFIASQLGTELGQYNYEAWRTAYWVMAAFMLVGVIACLFSQEPVQNSTQKYPYAAVDYLRFLGMFVVAILGFIAVFLFSSSWVTEAKQSLTIWVSNPALLAFILESLRLIAALAVVLLLSFILIKLDLVPSKMVDETYLAPIGNFFERYGCKTAVLLLLLVATYRISDILLGVMSNIFYLDLGFSKEDIALAVKTFGIGMVILGGFLGGILSLRFGLWPVLFAGALLSAATNLLFLLLNQMPGSLTVLYTVVAFDNLIAGLASAAFVAFLSSLTHVQFTAMQYAIFSSLMTLLPKILGGYSGAIVEQLNYNGFFILTALLGLPVLFLVLLVAGKLQNKK